MTIIIDYSHLAIHAILSNTSDLTKKKIDKSVLLDLARHAILTNIKYYKTKFKKHANEIIIAADTRNNSYWRKKVFTYYKGVHKKQPDDKAFDWPTIYSVVDCIREELAAYFPYKIIMADDAEIEDVVAVLTKWQNNNIVEGKDFFTEADILVLSNNDKFTQLQNKYNIKQWSVTQNNYVPTDVNILNTHIAKGDPKDGVPNVLSEDDVMIVATKRQSKMTAKRLQEFTLIGREACKNDTELRNWDRNNTLINFNNIPDYVEKNIVDTYLKCSPKTDLSNIMNYLIANNCSLFLESIENF